MSINTQIFLNSVLANLNKSITIPGDLAGQTQVEKEMLANDVSGLVDSLTDFSVQSASVNYGIETKSDTLNATLKKWLKIVNIEYLGRVFPGIDAVAEEYYKERWKRSSFPILKVAGWKRIDGLRLPTKLLFLEGSCVQAQDKNKGSKDLSVFSYDYYLGDPLASGANKLDKNVIITNPYGRMYDKYPVPFLIKRGIYNNFKLIQSIKNKQSELLNQILPYMFLVSKGNEMLAKERIKTYSDNDLKATLGQFQKLMDDFTTASAGEKTNKTPMRVTNFDEQLKHLIPDMAAMFNESLFATAEKNILTGLGFIDIAEAVSVSRKESILNPKVFMEDTKKAVKDFKSIINTLVIMVWQENNKNIKFKNLDYKVVSSPINTFMTEKFKQEIRLLWKHGQVSNQTYAEIVGEVDYEIEIKRRKSEAKKGIEADMSPHATDNKDNEQVADNQPQPNKTEDVNGKPIPEDKVDAPEAKDKYTVSTKDLDSEIKDVLSPDLQEVFKKTSTNALNTYNSETRAFRIAWLVVKKIAKKNSEGIWIRKKKRQDGKLKPVRLSTAMFEKVLEKESKEEERAIHQELQLKKLELIKVDLEKSKMQTELGKKLLKKSEEK